jgi:hypothetical protein
LLGALPSELLGLTTDSLDQADVLLDVIEGAQMAGLLFHESRQDATLIAELGNYTANLTQNDAAATLAELAGNPRYSTLLAGPFGESLLARYGIKDPEFFRRIAVEALGVNGSAAQRRHAAALKRVPQLRRVLGLVRGSRDAAVEEIRAPKEAVR